MARALGVYSAGDSFGLRVAQKSRGRLISTLRSPRQVPTDVDFRILLTFLDLYRTLVSFVLYKLYTDENLVYPPTLDVKLDESGEGVGKFKLEERAPVEGVAGEGVEGGKKVTKKEVRRGIRAVAAASAKVEEVNQEEDDVAMDGQAEEDTEDFVHHPSKNDEDDSAAPLPTYTSLLASTPSQQPSTSSLLFSPFTFYLSRETSSRTWEFVIRSFGGRVITSLNASDADNVTHVLIDRPIDAARMREMENGRKWVWVQPQWVADCVNQKTLLPSGPGSGYEPGATLPPHLSPWAGEGEVDRPWAGIDTAKEGVDDGEEAEDADEDKEEVTEESTQDLPAALLAAAQDPTNESLLHAAELEAEATGTPHATFRNQLKKATAAAGKSSAAKPAAVAIANAGEEDLRKIMMTGKKQKLYEKMQYSNNEKREEVSAMRRSWRMKHPELTVMSIFLRQSESQAGAEASGHREAQS
jgi:pescadillo protein